MSPASEIVQTRVGECLRVVREQQGLTLEQAAVLSGISKSHLSRLESSERQPSVASLLALSAAYGVPVGTLFGESPGGAPLAVIEAEGARSVSPGLAIAPCSGYAGSSVLDALRLTIDSGRPAPVPARHPGEEWLHVLTGRLELEYDGEVRQLEQGASAHFNAEIPHRLRAASAATELLLVVARPVRNLEQIH